MVIPRTWIREEMVFNSWIQSTRRMGQSRRIDDDQIQRKRTPSFSEPRVHCPEERPKAKEVENRQYTSVPMERRLKLFFAQLFPTISSVFTEQSQICAKNVILAMIEQGDLLWQDILTHCSCQVWWRHTHFWPMILHRKKIYCKDIRNELKGYHN